MTAHKYLVEEFLQLLVRDISPLLVFMGVGIDHLISKGTEGHVGSLRDVEKLAPVRFHHFATEQRP